MFKKFTNQLALRMFPDVGNGIIPHGFPMEELDFEYFDEMNFHYKDFIRIPRDVARGQLKNFVQEIEKNYQMREFSRQQPNHEIGSYGSRMQIPPPAKDIGNFDLSHSSSSQQNSGNNAPGDLNHSQRRKRGKRGGRIRKNRLLRKELRELREFHGNLSPKPETHRAIELPEHSRNDNPNDFDDMYEPHRPHQMNFKNEPQDRNSSIEHPFDRPHRDFHNNGPPSPSPRHFYGNELPSPYTGSSEHREFFPNERHDQRDLFERRSPGPAPGFVDQSQRNFHNNEPPRNFYDNGRQEPIPGTSNGSQRNFYDERLSHGNYYNEPPIHPQRDFFDKRSPDPVPKPAVRPDRFDNCPPAPVLRPIIKHREASSERQSRNMTKQPEIDFQEVDIFFKSISQKVKRANLTLENFKDLQSAVYNAISCKILPP